MTSHRRITPSILYFGTPVVVVSSRNPDGSTNLAPISSYWSLGDLIVIGIGADGQTAQNLSRHPEMVLNFVEDHQWQEVRALGELTGAYPVPPTKPDSCRFEPDKFGAVGWHALPADTVGTDRVAEAAVHLEARVTMLAREEDDLMVVHGRRTQVHVEERISVPGTSHVDPLAWRPLIYSFRHYFGLGERRGIAPHAEVQAALENDDA